MPYEDDRAGLAAIRAIADSHVVDEFRDQLAPRHDGTLLDLPPFAPCVGGTSRTHILAIDGSHIYKPVPGALPSTEAGLVSLGMVVIDIAKLNMLGQLPQSRSANPRQLRATEKGDLLGTMLPGRNAARQDGTNPRTWFRQIVNSTFEEANFGGESFAETLHALFGENRTIRSCPNPDCDGSDIRVPGPGESTSCPSCNEIVWLADGLRLHENFVENEPAVACHSRFRDALEVIALMNAIRHLERTALGRAAIGYTAFVMDGPLAAFGTIAVLAEAAHRELRRIQNALADDPSQSQLLVMSGVKSGPFVEHAAEIDRAPEPDSRIPRNHVWLPDNAYIRSNIIAGSSAQSQEWGLLTYFGRPVILKNETGQRLVFNLAQPEADPPLTNAPRPRVLDDAIATAAPLGVGAHQFLPLRRVHARAAIPLRLGTDLIESLAP